MTCLLYSKINFRCGWCNTTTKCLLYTKQQFPMWLIYIMTLLLYTKQFLAWLSHKLLFYIYRCEGKKKPYLTGKLIHLHTVPHTKFCDSDGSMPAYSSLSPTPVVSHRLNGHILSEECYSFNTLAESVSTTLCCPDPDMWQQLNIVSIKRCANKSIIYRLYQ